MSRPPIYLDPPTSLKTRKLLDYHTDHDGKAIIVSTHNLREAEKLCDTIAVMNKGRVVALAIPAVLCADSFAGEKERKTIEAILATPIRDSELLIGKTVLPLVASLSSSYLAFLIYSYLTNLLIFHRLIFPTYSWILIMGLLVPALTFFSVGTMIIISARSKGFREAQQIGGMIVLPVFVLLVTQLLGIMSMTNQGLMATSIILFVLDALLLKYGSRAYTRDHLVSNT